MGIVLGVVVASAEVASEVALAAEVAAESAALVAESTEAASAITEAAAATETAASAAETASTLEQIAQETTDFDTWYAASFPEETAAESAELAGFTDYELFQSEVAELDSEELANFDYEIVDEDIPEYLRPENMPSGGNFYESDKAFNYLENLGENLTATEPTASEPLSAQAKTALSKHLSKIWEEIASGQFTKKAAQQYIAAQITGRIKTGNAEADKILQRIADVSTGGVAFAEIKEGTSALIDALSAAGVKIPNTIQESFGGSSIKATYDTLQQSPERIFDTFEKVVSNSIPGLPPAIKQEPIKDFVPRPTIDPDIIDPSNIVGQEGNDAPISETITPEGSPLEGEGVHQETTKLELSGSDLFKGIKKANETPEMAPDEDKMISSVKNLIIYDNVGTPTQIPAGKYTDPHQMGVDVGNLVGLAANAFSSQGKIDFNNGDILDRAILNSIMKAATIQPSLSYLVKVVYGFLSQKIPDFEKSLGPEYTKIASIYNGKCLAPGKVYQNTKGQFSIVDEVGIINTYTGTSGSVPNYDTWVGPYGPNDKAPTTLVGVYAFLHDIGYDNLGYFNVTEDLKLLSRISQNFTRMGYQERVVAQVTMQYFSNVGIVLGALKTKYLPDNIDEVTYDTGFGGVDDIYSHLIPSSSEDVSEQLKAGRQAVSKVRDETRTIFYQGLREGVEQMERVTLGQLATGPQTIGNSAILQSFLNLGVVSIS